MVRTFRRPIGLLGITFVLVSGCSYTGSDAAQNADTGSSGIAQSPSNSSPSTSGSDSNQSATEESGYVLEEASVKAALAVEPIERTMWQRRLIGASCLKKHGITVTLDPIHPDRLRFKETGKLEDEELLRISDRCDKENQLLVTKPVTREDAIKEYQHRVATKTCFAENQIIVSDPPSQNAFVAKYLRSERTTEDLGVWDPWDQFPGGANPDALAKKCPRYREGA